jgi:hypothetical protein
MAETPIDGPATVSLDGVELGEVHDVEVTEPPQSLAGHDPTYGDIDAEGCAILPALMDYHFREGAPVVVEGDGYLRPWREGMIHGFIVGAVTTTDPKHPLRYRVRVRLPVYGPSPLQGAYRAYHANIRRAIEEGSAEVARAVAQRFGIPADHVGPFEPANYAAANIIDASWSHAAGNIVEDLHAVAEAAQSAEHLGYTPDHVDVSPYALNVLGQLPQSGANCLDCRFVRRQGETGTCTRGVHERVDARMCCGLFQEPPPLDLTRWPAACQFLTRFARCPWDWSPLSILADWLDEHSGTSGMGDKVRTWIKQAQQGDHGRVFLAEIDWGKMTRTKRRFFIANVRARLRETFGDYDGEERQRAIPF